MLDELKSWGDVGKYTFVCAGSDDNLGIWVDLAAEEEREPIAKRISQSCPTLRNSIVVCVDSPDGIDCYFADVFRRVPVHVVLSQVDRVLPRSIVTSAARWIVQTVNTHFGYIARCWGECARNLWQRRG